MYRGERCYLFYLIINNLQYITENKNLCLNLNFHLYKIYF